MQFNYKYILVLLLTAMPATLFAAASSKTLSLSFEECLSRSEAVVGQMGIKQRDIIPIVKTNIMTMTKYCTVDGSIIITCSKPDRAMVITDSTSYCR